MCCKDLKEQAQSKGSISLREETHNDQNNQINPPGIQILTAVDSPETLWSVDIADTADQVCIAADKMSIATLAKEGRTCAFFLHIGFSWDCHSLHGL
jgi:hypothetical protein